MGSNTKMIITGDLTQIDLPQRQASGLIQALHILKEVPGIAFITLNKKDIVRHKLVTRIVEAYDAYDKEKKVEYVNYKVFGFEMADGSTPAAGTTAPAPKKKAALAEEGEVEEDDLPF